jgi:hypothetical protein
MEASKEHMLSEHAAIRKMDSTVLDCFTALADNNEGLRIEAGVKLLEHVFRKQVKFQVRVRIVYMMQWRGVRCSFV